MTKIKIELPAAHRAMCAKLQDAGYVVYAVGGFVRDSVLGIEPHDIDYVTDAPMSAINRIFSRCIGDVQSQKFGVVALLLTDAEGHREKVDLAVFRKDLSCDGRHAEVQTEGVTMEEDAQRRDFTINAMYADLATGEVIDPTGMGLADLEAKELRFVGEPSDRIREDYLRALRLARFVSKTGFADATGKWSLKPGDFESHGVKPERIGEELKKLFAGNDPRAGLEAMRRHGIFDALGWGKDIKAMDYIQPRRYHAEGSVWRHTMMVVDEARKLGADWMTVAAAMFHDVRKPQAYSLNKGKNAAGHAEASAKWVEENIPIQFWGDDARRDIAWLVSKHMEAANMGCKPDGTSKNGYLSNRIKIWDFVSHVLFNKLYKLCLADKFGSTRMAEEEPGIAGMIHNKAVMDLASFDGECWHAKAMPHLVTSKDIIGLGLPDKIAEKGLPTHTFGDILKEAFRLQLKWGDKGYSNEEMKTKILSHVLGRLGLR